MPEPMDLNALSDAIRRSRDAFVEQTEPHRPALWDYCLRLTGSPWDAEDLVQETMLRAFARLGNFWQPIRDGRAYLFRTATNTWIDGLRRARSEAVRRDVALDDLDAIPGAEAADAAVHAREALAHLVAALPPRQRVVLLLADVFEFRNREIGAMIGVTEGAVKALLHRARTTLRESRAAAADPAPTARRPVELSPEEQAILARFVDAFNRKDPDALLELLDADAATVIVGVAEEHGRDVIRDQSLAEEITNPTPQTAELGFLFGEPVVLVYTTPPDQPRTLGWIIRLGLSGGKICRWYSYYFTPELIRHAAAAIGVPASPAGYRYIFAGTAEPLPTP